MRARALGGAGPDPFIPSFVHSCVRSRVRSLAPAFSPSCAQASRTRAFIHCRRHSLTRAHRSAPLFTSFVLPCVRPSFIRSRAPARVALSSAHPLPAGPSRPARLAGPCPARPGRAGGRAGLGPGRSEVCANICFGAGWVKVTARAARAGRGARRGGGRAGRGRRAGETRAGGAARGRDPASGARPIAGRGRRGLPARVRASDGPARRARRGCGAPGPGGAEESEVRRGGAEGDPSEGRERGAGPGCGPRPRGGGAHRGGARRSGRPGLGAPGWGWGGCPGAGRERWVRAAGTQGGPGRGGRAGRSGGAGDERSLAGGPRRRCGAQRRRRTRTQWQALRPGLQPRVSPAGPELGTGSLEATLPLPRLEEGQLTPRAQAHAGRSQRAARGASHHAR